MTVEEWVTLGAVIAEVVGVAVILLGGLVSGGLVWYHARGEFRSWYPLYRRYFGHAILLGLEFLVAADIIRTVSHAPTIPNVVTLGLIVLIRTFLSFTLELEIEGNWPWQRTARAQRKREAPPDRGG